MAALSGKLTKNWWRIFRPGGMVMGPACILMLILPVRARWIVQVTVKGRKIANGGPLRTDFGLGGAD